MFACTIDNELLVIKEEGPVQLICWNFVDYVTDIVAARLPVDVISRDIQKEFFTRCLIKDSCKKLKLQA